MLKMIFILAVVLLLPGLRSVAAETTTPTTTTIEADMPPELPVLTVVGDQRQRAARADRTAASVALPSRVLAAPGATLAEAIRRSPGVHATSDGTAGGQAAASIRGANMQQTRVFVDGVPVQQAGGNSASLSLLPLDHIERVEIYRSATPIGYGRHAVGGVIDVQTARPGRKQWLLGTGGGSFGTFEARTSAALPISDASWTMAGVAYRRTDGDFPYTNDKGTAFDTSDDEMVRRGNNHGEQWDALVKGAHWFDAGWRAFATQTVYQFNGGLPGNGLRQATVASRSDLRLQTHVGLQTPNLGRSDWHGELAGYYSLLRQQQKDPLQEFGLTPNDSDNRTHTIGGKAQFAGNVAGPLNWITALNLESQRYVEDDAMAAGPALPNAERLSIDIANQPRLQLDDWRLELLGTVTYSLVRSDVQHSRGFGGVVIAGQTVTEHLPDYRLGVLQRPADWLTLKANYGIAHRLPSFIELFGDSAFIQPSPNLNPERGRTLDLGGTGMWTGVGNGGWAIAEVFGFISEIDNVIQFVRSSSDTFVARNLDGATIAGVETALELDAGDWIAAGLGYDWLWTRQQSEAPSRAGKKLPLRPAHRMMANVEFYRKALWHLDRIGVQAELDYESGNFMDLANVVQVPARTRLNLGASLTTWKQQLELAFRVRNVTDNRVHDLINLPLPGRNYYATATLKLS